MRPCLKLRQRLLEKDYTMAELAKEIGRSNGYLSQVFAGKTVADASDILGLAEALEIPAEQWKEYFFPLEIQKRLKEKLKERSGKN